MQTKIVCTDNYIDTSQYQIDFFTKFTHLGSVNSGGASLDSDIALAQSRASTGLR